MKKKLIWLVVAVLAMAACEPQTGNIESTYTLGPTAVVVGDSLGRWSHLPARRTRTPLRHQDRRGRGRHLQLDAAVLGALLAGQVRHRRHRTRHQ